MIDPKKYQSDYAEFLARLQEARRKAGLTQLQVSAILGKHQSFVSKCESGERRVDPVELSYFLRVYKVDIGFFFQ